MSDYQAIEDWVWDKHKSNSKQTCHHHEKLRLYHQFLFVQSNCQNQCNLGNFEFIKIEGIIHIYKETGEKPDDLFQTVYTDAVNLVKEFGIEEKWSASQGQQIDWNNIPTETFKGMLAIISILMFLDIAFADIKSGSVKGSGHIMNYACLFWSMIKIR